jgi:hypothetical protein
LGGYTESGSKSVRALVAFNGAGMVGMISMMQRPGSLLLQIKICGGMFLLGFTLACIGWIANEAIDGGLNSDHPKAIKFAIAGMMYSAALFFGGALWAYWIAIHIN